MMRSQKQWIAAAAVALAGSMTLSACGMLSGSSSTDQAGSGAMSSDPAMAMATATPSASMMSTTRGGLMEVKDSMSGLILANPHGMTVYWYSTDKKGSGVSSCTGSCAVEWPPVAAPVRLPAGFKLSGPIGYIVRPNGEHQVTIDGYPIYRYAGDKAPGQTSGNGIGGVWRIVKVKKTKSGGSMGGSMSGSTTSSSSSTSGSGGGW
jgi:predicted lipoprotein with Yx(FWY)xxD motif